MIVGHLELSAIENVISIRNPILRQKLYQGFNKRRLCLSRDNQDESAPTIKMRKHLVQVEPAMWCNRMGG
ncbi:MAG: hypothetical protein WDO56_05140 [Gammaproteobacteria bacterium]